jgi:dTMP kinase
MLRRGLFITLEGIDGSGKSTHLRAVVSWLRGKGLKVVSTKEPWGGSISGRAVRRLLLGRARQSASGQGCAPGAKSGRPDLAELLLFIAARADHTSNLILPHLRRGEVVVSERYADSSLAYQGYGRGLDLNMIRQLNEKACQALRPDLTILLDLAPNQAIPRLSGRRRLDRLETLGLSFHRRVRNGYLELARAEPDRIKVIDASASRLQARREILRILERAIARNPGKASGHARPGKEAAK